MRSAPRGKPTFPVEVSGISPHGIWLFLGDEEAFLPFEEFPWFRDAAVSAVLRVERTRADHLYWPDLDVDLSVDSIRHPNRYPLVSQVREGGDEKPKKSPAKRRRP